MESSKITWCPINSDAIVDLLCPTCFLRVQAVFQLVGKLHPKLFRHINSNDYINVTVLWVQFLSVVDQQSSSDDKSGKLC